MHRAVIIDDEITSQRSLEKIIELYFKERICVVGMANSLKLGIQLINKHKPDIVFLDMEMPVQGGLELFDYLEINFEVVVITAYKGYAIEALRMGASDYLLKPINIKELLNCIDRIDSTQEADNDLPADLLKYNSGKLLLPNIKGFFIVAFTEIVAMEADGNYTWVYKKNKEKLHISKTLGYIEQMLPARYFLRSHRSSIVNVNFITEINKENGIIILGEMNQPLSEKNTKIVIDKLNEMLDGQSN